MRYFMVRNKRLFIFFFLFVIIIQSPIFSTDTLTTTLSDGRKVILFPDGKWIFEENNIQQKDTLLAIPTKRAFSHPPFNAEKSTSDYFFKIKYDKFKNATIVTVNLVLQKQPNKLSFSSLFFYEGTTPKPPTIVVIIFHTVSENWLFLKNTNLSMLINGNRKDFGEMERSGDVGSGYVSENLSQKISLEKFLEIVNAKSIEGQLFNIEFQFTNEQLEALRDFASRME